MTLGALAFLNPWLLTALASLPLIYWLLRTVPPRPKQVAFPATRILVGLENDEKTPAKHALVAAAHSSARRRARHSRARRAGLEPHRRARP